MKLIERLQVAVIRCVDDISARTIQAIDAEDVRQQPMLAGVGSSCQGRDVRPGMS